jgi:uncharacterized protein
VGHEVKAAATLNANDTAGLRALGAEVGKKWIRGIVLYTGLDVIPFANNLHGVPCRRCGSQSVDNQPYAG